MHPRRVVRTTVALALAAVLAACGSTDTASMVASGKQYMQKGDMAAAIIQLRNAKQQSPDNAEVRYLLGRALVATGDWVGAEADLRRARELKYPDDQVVPLLALATFERERRVEKPNFRRVVQEFPLDKLSDPAARAELATTLAAVHLELEQFKEAESNVSLALAAQPKSVRAHVMKARVAVARGDLPAAEASVDAALAIAPKDAEALVSKVYVMIAQGRRDEATKLLEKSVAEEPQSLALRALLVQLLVGQGRAGDAEPRVAEMKKLAPNDPATRFAEAEFLVAKNEAAKAREILQPLVARNDNPRYLFLWALANYQLRNFVEAEDAARKVIASRRNDIRAWRVLAATYLQWKRPGQAAEVADEALERWPEDLVLLRVAGEARMHAGNVGEAARFYERAAALEKQGSAARMRLAEIRLRSGDADAAVDDLERLAAADPKNIQADLALYAVHLRRREFGPALEAVAAIEKKQPNAAIGPELRANVALAQRKRDEARKYLNRALAIEPGRIAAARALAVLDLQEGKAAEAKARYEKMIAADPRSDELLIRLAELQAYSGAPAADVRATLDRAIAVNPSSSAPHVALIAHYRRIGDSRGALDAARAGVKALPNDARLVEVLGALQLQAGEATQARETFSRLVQLRPDDAEPLRKLAEVHVAQRDFVSAQDVLRRAVTIQPDSQATGVALVSMYMASGKVEDAITEARRLQKDRPKDPMGYLIEAEIHLVQKKPAEAIAATKQAFDRAPSTALAARYYGLLASQGKAAEANALAQAWIKQHPKDAQFHVLVGQYRQMSKDVDGALAAYRAALALDPENAVVLNNVAWILHERGRQDAREYAERAYAAAPLNASIVDTYGNVLVKQGDTKRGIELLRMATQLAPADARLRIHLAQALIATGDKSGAKRELEIAVKTDARSPARAEAEKLLREI